MEQQEIRKAFSSTEQNIQQAVNTDDNSSTAPFEPEIKIELVNTDNNIS